MLGYRYDSVKLWVPIVPDYDLQEGSTTIYNNVRLRFAMMSDSALQQDVGGSDQAMPVGVAVGCRHAGSRSQGPKSRKDSTGCWRSDWRNEPFRIVVQRITTLHPIQRSVLFPLDPWAP
jgi:hypothetical protein